MPSIIICIMPSIIIGIVPSIIIGIVPSIISPVGSVHLAFVLGVMYIVIGGVAGHLKFTGGVIMVAINAIYDGSSFKPVDPIPVDGGYEVVITFVKPVEDDREEKCRRILEYCGAWDQEDVKLMEEMVAERGKSSRDREEA